MISLQFLELDWGWLQAARVRQLGKKRRPSRIALALKAKNNPVGNRGGIWERDEFPGPELAGLSRQMPAEVFPRSTSSHLSVFEHLEFRGVTLKDPNGVIVAGRLFNRMGEIHVS